MAESFSTVIGGLASYITMRMTAYKRIEDAIVTDSAQQQIKEKTMWNYIETDAYHSISLHDCRTDDMKLEGNDLIISFPDGFWITPASKHIDCNRPLKTGPSQLCIYGFGSGGVIDTVDLFKTTYLFRKPILCRRINMEPETFLKLIGDGKHELEFLYEFHRPEKCLYQCWLWKKNHGMEAECQFEITAKCIEYRWNVILPDRKW